MTKPKINPLNDAVDIMQRMAAVKDRAAVLHARVKRVKAFYEANIYDGAIDRDTLTKRCEKLMLTVFAETMALEKINRSMDAEFKQLNDYVQAMAPLTFSEHVMNFLQSQKPTQ